MCFTIKHFNLIGHKDLVYADDIVIFSCYSHIDLTIRSLNKALSSLFKILSSSVFFLEKYKFLFSPNTITFPAFLQL